MRRLGTPVQGSETGTRHVEVRLLRTEQAHGRAALALVTRILGQFGPQQIAALEADVQVEHIGDNPHARLRAVGGCRRYGCALGAGHRRHARRCGLTGRHRGQLRLAGRLGRGRRRGRAAGGWRLDGRGRSAIVAIPLDDVHPAEQRQADPQVQAWVIHETVA
jgi:hypothetical protein